MEQKREQTRYQLRDSRGMPLAYALLESGPDEHTCLLNIQGNKISAVMEHEQIRMSPVEDGPVLLGRVLRNEGSTIVLERLEHLDSDLRQDLRMPTHFESFIYPLTGEWKGRRQVEADDLSCGGIAFFCPHQMEKGEKVEIVIPITSQPVILNCQILRRRPSDRKEPLYAAKFVDMCNDEEVLVREAVLSLEVRNLKNRRKHL